MAGAVGLISYLSLKAGQEAVKEVSGQLRQELSDRVQQQLENYVETPFLINSMNSIAFEEGNLNLTQINSARSLWQQANTTPTTNLIYCGRESDGTFLGVGRDSNTPGMPLQVQLSNPATHYQFRYGKLASDGTFAFTARQSLSNRPYDPRLRPWYLAAKQKQQATWSDIYLDFDDLVPVITASQPVYDRDGKTLLGVCATDFLLSVELNSFLSQLQIGKSGETFILERSGVLVSSSTSNEETLIVGEGANTQRLLAIHSQNWLVSETTRHLIEHFGDLHRIQAAQQFSFNKNGNQMVQVRPFQDARGLDWLIVVVVPEADFMEQVQTNTYTTGLLCLLALVGATQVSFFTARRITKPLLQLNRAAKQIADGDWNQPIEVAQNDEVGELARSFNHMVSQLKMTFAEKQALNQALTNKQTQLSQILEALPIGVVMVRPESSDSDGSDGYLNQVGQRLLGGLETQSSLSLKQLAKYRVYQAGTQQLYPSEKMPILRALKGETVNVDDLEIHRADGQVISLEVRAIPVLDTTGQVIYAICTLQDITERKWIASLLEEYNQSLEREVHERTIALEQEIAERRQVEAALRQSETQNRAIVRAIPDLIFSTNADGIFLDYSHSNQLDDLVPDNIDPTGRSLFEMLPQEIATQHLGYIQLALATRELQTYEQQIWINDKLQEEEVRVIPTGDDRVLFIIRNISVRKHMESQLQAQQAFLWSVIDVCPYPIFVKDTSGRFLILNQACAAIYSKTVEQMLGKHDGELNTNQQQVEEFQRSNQMVMETGETMIFPNQAILNADGKLDWYQSIIKPFHNLRGEVQGIIGTSINISDHKNAEVALQQAKEAAEAANRAKSAFLAGMSH
ncbi:MAG TPA: PAS domain-containing protein, partial [Allocoleopsis sp.]